MYIQETNVTYKSFDALKTFPLACNNTATIGTTQWPKSAPFIGGPNFCELSVLFGDSTVCHGTQQLMDFTCVLCSPNRSFLV